MFSSNHKGHHLLHSMKSHRCLKAEDPTPPTTPTTLLHTVRKANAASTLSIASRTSSEASASPSELSVASRPSLPEWDSLRCHPPMITSPVPSILSPKNSRATPSSSSSITSPVFTNRRFTHHHGAPSPSWEPRPIARERAGSVPTLDIHDGFDFGFDPLENKTGSESDAAAKTAAWAKSASYAVVPTHPPRLVDIPPPSARRNGSWKRQGFVLVSDDVREEIYEAYKNLP